MRSHLVAAVKTAQSSTRIVTGGGEEAAVSFSGTSRRGRRGGRAGQTTRVPRAEELTCYSERPGGCGSGFKRRESTEAEHCYYHACANNRFPLPSEL